MVLATLLAFIAVLGMVALSGWHGATIHDDDPVHAASVEHSHADTDQDDPDGAIHLAAHAVGQSLAVPAHIEPSHLVVELASIWPSGELAGLRGLDPTSLLRPPRA